MSVRLAHAASGIQNLHELSIPHGSAFGRSSSSWTMFVSRPPYELPIPAALMQGTTQHWRMVELALHEPWFLLSIEICDANDPELRATRTLCVAWERDLLDVLREVDSAQVQGLVCMRPAWLSTDGQWSSREVQEVWVCSSSAGDSLLLCDAEGERLDLGLEPKHVEPMERTLVLRVETGSRERAPQEKRGIRRSTTPGAGRFGKAGA